jgi:hypothetical protein
MEEDKSKSRPRGILHSIKRSLPTARLQFLGSLNVKKAKAFVVRADARHNVQLPVRLVLTTASVFLILPLILFGYRELHMVPSDHTSASVVHPKKVHVRGNNGDKYPTWMENNLIKSQSNYSTLIKDVDIPGSGALVPTGNLTKAIGAEQQDQAGSKHGDESEQRESASVPLVSNSVTNSKEDLQPIMPEKSIAAEDEGRLGVAAEEKEDTSSKEIHANTTEGDR